MAAPAEAAAADLAEHHGVTTELWSATSYKLLRDDALACERWNRLHPTETARVPFVTGRLAGVGGAVVAVSDYLRLVPEQIARFVPGGVTILGTDGFGRSDTRDALRRHFEIDAAHIVVATLHDLARRGVVQADEVAGAIARHDLPVDLPDPWDPTIY